VTGPAASAGDGGWAGAVPEICIGCAVIAVTAVAGYALAGIPGTAVAMAASAVAALIVIRVIGTAPGSDDPENPYIRSSADVESSPASFAGYWRRRAGLGDGIASLAAYDAELRGTLQRLLAARLAERHGVSLQSDPAAARRLLCPRPRDQDLWYWVDPSRPSPAAPAQHAQGIPPRTLARIIDRLERL
jgi:hypothetical protein